MFADVKGSMDLSGTVDVEEWWGIMRGFFAILSDGVQRYEGRVDRFTGDGVMAVFGAPSALEDHAHRACHAALWLRDELARYADQLQAERGVSFTVRIGLNSGEVVVGTIGDGASSEYTAIGRTAGLAQRIESVTEPGEVYVSESTGRLVRGYFELQERKSIRVKGVEEPLRVLALSAAGAQRTAFEMSVLRGLSRFVGREPELSELEHAFANVCDRQARLLAVVGEAGVGKSRLCHEFLSRRRREGTTVLEAHALAHTREVPFLPLLDLLRQFFGIDGADEIAVAKAKVVERLTGQSTLLDAQQALLEFLGLASELRLGGAEARQRRLVAALQAVVRAAARAAPIVVFVEDLHWIDPGSTELLKALMEGVAGTRTMLLTTYRPEHESSWLTAMPEAHEIRLDALRGAAGDALARNLLGGDASLEPLTALVAERSDGNPFFIEEIVKSLSEHGVLQGVRGEYRLTRDVRDVEIPDTIQTLLSARMDRLPALSKLTLHTAAVVGRRFSKPLLERVSGLPADDLRTALQDLVKAELVFTGPGDGEYMFKHSLAERVAYQSQLGEQRSARHAAVAEAIVESEAAREDELAALIAHHWERAEQPMQAARWSMRAATWAGFKDPNEALRQLERVRNLSDRAAPSAERDELALTARAMLLNLRWRQGVPGDQTRQEFERSTTQLFEETRRLASAAGNVAVETVAVAAFGAVRGVAGHLEDMAELGMEAVALADRHGDRSLKLSVLPGPIYGMYALGRYKRVLEVLDAALAELPEDRESSTALTIICPYAWILSWRAAALAHSGELRRAFVEFENALAIARSRDDFETESWTLMSIVQATQLAGGTDALSTAMRAKDIVERTGGAFSVGLAWRYLGIAHLLRGEWRAAIDAINAALATWRPRQVGLEAEPHALTMLSRALLGDGDAEAAVGVATEAVALATVRHTQGHELEARLALCDALCTAGGAGGAPAVKRHLVRAAALVTETGARTLEPRVHMSRAQLAALEGDDSRRVGELDVAAALFEEVGAEALALGARKMLQAAAEPAVGGKP